MPSLLFFWQGQILPGLLVTLPAAVASALVMRYADLDGIKASRAGAYLARHMGPAVQAVRGVGALVMIFGAWYHALWLIPAGLAIVLAAWFHGLLLDRASRGSP